MTWAEFRQWARETYGYRMNYQPKGAHWCRLWSSGHSNVHRGRAGTGSGHNAVYGELQKRRLAAYLRVRFLIEKIHIAAWLDAAEPHNNGWLVNDGSGIRWVAHPETEAHQLMERGFVAVKCGL